MSKIFLSHTSIDKPFVRKLANDLRSNGHTVWIDEAEINIGDSLIGKIRDGLDSVDYVAVILSQASIKSEWVQKELEIASNRELKEKKKVVLPIKIEDVELPGFLEGKFYGDFSNEKEYSEKLELLLRSLGDGIKVIPQTEEEINILKEQLKDAREVIKKHEQEIGKITEYNLSKKSDQLQKTIKIENVRNPKYAPINNVYAFELVDLPITVGYLLHILRKIKMKGSHPVEFLLQVHNKWDDVNRMIEALADMIESKDNN